MRQTDLRDIDIDRERQKGRERKRDRERERGRLSHQRQQVRRGLCDADQENMSFSEGYHFLIKRERQVQSAARASIFNHPISTDN